ncbi:tetratricopeptide repeat-containing hybrid sensor histidine kinase/response regulator [Neotamlana laminarinivorans]|uniref:histidine kinase n=1 Tax=Neotamlana laminarinivorans TaxID=2883124 RepID=A0A9X1L0L6_9FLAO|nr:response regulator [Tamlana laminarinivorans]MCB4797700.1 response regulator [Tamlana laminarinivorans]
MTRIINILFIKQSRFYFIVAFLFLIVNPLFGQEKIKDSLEAQLIHAYNLSMESKVSEALHICKEVLNYEKKHKNDTIKAVTYSIMGTSHYLIDNDSTALKYYLKSLEINKALGLNLRVINGINNVGIAYAKLGEYQKSIDYYQDAADLAINIEAYKHAIHPLYNIGDYYIEQLKQPKKGLEYIKKAEYYYYNKSNTEEDILMKVDILSAYGEGYFLLKDFTTAERYLNQAIEAAKENNYLSELKKIYNIKTQILNKQHRYQEANTILYSMMQVNDSILKNEKFDIAQEMLAKFEVAENEEKLRHIEKEKKLQATTIKKISKYNIAFTILIVLLILALIFIFLKLKQLKIAKEKAQQLSRAKSDFYSEISHELRTPLYAVIEISNILLKENLNEDNRVYLESLKFSGDHLLSLINNVLELNKIEAGKSTIEDIVFSPKQLITNIIESLEFAISDTENTIVLEYDDTIPEKLIGDSLKLSQIFINLITNAIKFTNKGVIKVVLNNESITDDGKICNLYAGVKDSGVGISLKNQKKIFSDFYQEHAKTDKSYRGTGLGLSIVKRQLQLMGSEIKIKSVINKGSTFYFTIPIKIATVETKINLLKSKADLLKGNTFLVVDDNNINQLITKKILLQLELECDVVDSGLKAIDAAQKKDYNCILMDLNMPEMNGYKATEKIRQFNISSTIIALTAYASDDVKNKILNSKMDGFIQKPFFIDDFISTIQNGLQLREQITAKEIG